MFSLGEVALVARDTTIGEALAEGWQLVTHNVLNCLIITLLSIGFIIAFMIIFAVAGLLTFGPLNLLIATISDSPVAILLLGLVLGLPVSLVVGGYFGTFFNALYIQFYFGLVEPTPVPAAAAPASPSSGPAVS